MKIDVRADIPPRLKKYLANPGPVVKDARGRADKDALILLRDGIKQAAPRKKGGLAGSIEVDLAKKKVFSKLVYSRAVELGHFAEAEPGHHLRFPGTRQGGAYVFPTKRYKGTRGTTLGALGSFIRTEAQPFFFPTLPKKRFKLIDIYKKAFARMLEKL